MKTKLLFLTLCLTATQLAAAETRTVQATLNGTELIFDAERGTLLRLSYPGVGDMLNATPERSSLIDLAYPVPKFEVLRLGARHSLGANIKLSSDTVEIHWPRLGMSRTNFSVEGNVSATVKFTAAPDGRSIICTASVHNESKNTVRQVLFPDFNGLVPIDGKANETILRTSLGSSAPFLNLAKNEDRLSQQYMSDHASYSMELQSGGMFSSMGMRWMDYGSLKGGFSLHTRQWGWDAPITIRLHLSEVEQKLRLIGRNDMVLETGGKWQSQEFWLTPHTGGWAKGIEPFRAWVQQKYKREFPLPKRIRDSIGYRTVWMCQGYPNDPQDPVFRFKDLPGLAQEAADHGLTDMVMWSWVQGFERPLPPPFPHLGTEQDFYDTVKACRKLGVTLSPFISIVQAHKTAAPRYGLAVGDNNGWTQHSELVPRWNPPYASGLACVGIPTSHPLWQEDSFVSCKKLVDNGATSISWDQYWTTTAAEPNMQTLTKKIRDYALKADPEATFSAEQLWNLEIDSGYLDFTWNWGGWRDCAALTSVLPTPRINSCVSESPLVVKKVFADNLFINAMPRRNELPNASDWIKNAPAMSVALKQCAALKKQFLPYFTEGTFIGNCLLTEPTTGAHAAVYVLPTRLLMLLINEHGPRKVSFSTDLGAWLKDKPHWQVNTFNENGGLVSKKKFSESLWRGQTPKLATGEMCLLEVVTRE